MNDTKKIADKTAVKKTKKTSVKKKPKSLIEKIYEIQRDIGSIEKKDGGGVPYKVIAYNDVNKEVREQMTKQRICMIPSTSAHTRNGNFTEVDVGITLINLDNLDDKLTIEGFKGYGVDQSDKGIGKAYSYGYKYLFMKLFNMNIGKDEESEDKDTKRKEPKEKQDDSAQELDDTTNDFAW